MAADEPMHLGRLVLGRTGANLRRLLRDGHRSIDFLPRGTV